MAQSHHADIQFLIILKLIRESLYLFVYFLGPFIKAGAVKHKKKQ